MPVVSVRVVRVRVCCRVVEAEELLMIAAAAGIIALLHDHVCACSRELHVRRARSEFCESLS